MNAVLPPVWEVNSEIAALIEVLDHTEQRLEELTAGEVDTETDREGQTFLLRRARETVRHTEAARRATILDALPAHIALLDAQGIIIAVNEAWRKFSSANTLAGPAHWIGVDYLAICDRGLAAHPPETHQVAEGIRSVLSGAATSFSSEYRCHLPADERWFLLKVTPLATDRPIGAVVMHLDVTAEKQTQEILRVSESRYRQITDNIRDVFFLRSIDSSQMYYVSPAYEHIWGRTCQSLYSDPTSWADCIHPDDVAHVFASSGERRSASFDYEFRIVRADGDVRWIKMRGFPILDESGVVYRTAGVATDITVRKEAEEKNKRLNRVYSVLSGIHSLIVRAIDSDGLLKEACRIVVEAGAFKLAWIGLIDPQTLEGEVTAWCGVHERFLAGVQLTARADRPDSEQPACRALRTLEPVICNDIASDPSVGPLRAELLGRGYRSMACFPMMIAGRPKGVMALFAADAGAFDDSERQLLVQLSADISYALDHLEKADKLDYLAYYDPLTGLANRRLLRERVTQCLGTAVSGSHKLAVCVIDVDGFKNINDTFGQSEGDALLRQTAEWLTRTAGNANLLARVGADQFVVLIPEISHQDDVERLLQKTIRAFTDHPFQLNNGVFRISAKVGVALFPENGVDADSLLGNAEAALKKAKASGERYLFYAERMTQTVIGRLNLEFQLRLAFENQQFVLHYQPKLDLVSGKLTGAEALIRWNDPRTGLVAPGRFIPTLEKSGLIFEVGRWALRKAIEDYLRWRAAGLAAVRISVNVSPLQLRNAGFIGEIRQAIGIDPHAAAGLELEITESVIMEDVKNSIESLRAIRAMGVKIAIDDFGTGFSSLSYLSKLPVDTLKIDRSFVIDMTASPEGLSLVSTIINLAHALRLTVVAEGVETEEESRLLKLLSCDELQGFLFGRPVPSDIFESKYLAPSSAG
jgi:diguanylate cyclase (GGDEF)-like protein/PAS domain S-box-containing protein